MIRQTSKKAYRYLKEQGCLPKERKIIYDTLVKFKNKGIFLTRCEIAYELDKEKSSISARVNEMLNIGIVKEGKKRKDKISGRTAYELKV